MILFPASILKAEISEEVLEIQQKIKNEGLSWIAGQTSMMDLSIEERQMRLGLEIPDEVLARFEILNNQPPPQLLNTQEFFDWREFGVVTPVKDQGQCGSCWDFAATGAFESVYSLATGILPDFSEQQGLVCNNGGGCRMLMMCIWIMVWLMNHACLTGLTIIIHALRRIVFLWLYLRDTRIFPIMLTL